MTQNDLLAPNPSRQELERILNSLAVPPNYRVVLTVERDTEKLLLKVLKVEPWEFKLFGRVVYREKPKWSDKDSLQRVLTARTYEGLLTLLREDPEFLEFEVVIGGGIRYCEPVTQSI